jgi:6-phosphogluconolactonase
MNNITISRFYKQCMSVTRRRGCVKIFLPLVIGFVCLVAPLQAQFAYVANSGSSNVSAYRIGANGTLTPVPGSPFATGSYPQSVAVDPTGEFAYVANSGSSNVSAYRIGANGALTSVPGSPFAVGAPPNAVAVDPTGKFAYVTNPSPSNEISAYSIGANGVLTPVPGSPFATGSYDDLSVAVDPTGKFVYAANARNNDVSAYGIGANGALTPVPGSPFKAGSLPLSVAVDPTAKFVYVANAEGVSAYSIGANGALTQLLGSPFPAGFLPNSVAVDPTAKFVYVANEGSFGVPSNVSAYSIGANGALAPIPGSPFPAGLNPRSVAITSRVPFASSFATLEIAKRGFVLGELFTLGTISNGINPVTENVTLQIGTFSVTIPPGSFKQIALRISGFQGVIKNVNLNVQIVALGNNIFALAAESKGVNLTGLTNPVTVVLTIGNETGSTAIPRKNEREKRDDGQGKQEREDQETGDEEE